MTDLSTTHVNALSVESGGLGAMASGDIYLAAGAVLKIVVGGAGGSASGYSAGGGGGGGSFVIESNSGSGSVDIDEVIAGGGGGANTQANGQGGLAGQTAKATDEITATASAITPPRSSSGSDWRLTKLGPRMCSR